MRIDEFLNIILSVVLGVAVLAIIAFFLVVIIHSPEPEVISFADYDLNKDKYSVEGKYIEVENGVVVWYNESNRIRMAVVVQPATISSSKNTSNLTSKDYIILKVPEFLKKGERVNVKGVVEKIETESGDSIYYLQSFRIDKTGELNDTEIDYQNIFNLIKESEEREDADDFSRRINDLIFSPVSPLSPASPSNIGNPMSSRFR